MSNETTQRATRMLATLQERGCRLTEPRRAIVAVLAEGHQHLNHAEILERAKAKYADIGRATVYRTLELLLEAGVIHATYLGDANQRFIVPLGGHHHHLVCNRCGNVTDLEECHFNSALSTIHEQTGFQIDSHLVELYGTCTDCQGANGG